MPRVVFFLTYSSSSSSSRLKAIVIIFSNFLLAVFAMKNTFLLRSLIGNFRLGVVSA